MQRPARISITFVLFETVVEIPAGGEAVPVSPEVGNPEVIKPERQQGPLPRLKKVAIFLCCFLASHLAWESIKLGFDHVTIVLAGIAKYAWLYDLLQTASTLFLS